MPSVSPELLDEAVDEILSEKPHWREDGCARRLDAGVFIACHGKVKPVDTVCEGRYQVGSRVVNIATFSCACPESECQGTCPHIIAVLVYVRAQQMRAEFERAYEVWDVRTLADVSAGEPVP